MRRLDQCQQYVFFESSARQVNIVTTNYDLHCAIANCIVVNVKLHYQFYFIFMCLFFVLCFENGSTKLVYYSNVFLMGSNKVLVLVRENVF